MTSDPDILEQVHVPARVLKDYGCRACVWKSVGQCPHGYDLDSDDEYKDGYCNEFAKFLLSLRAQSDSLSQMKEKFFLYTQEIQAMEDRMRFLKLERELRELEEMEYPGTDTIKRKKELRMSIEAYKIWWERLTTAVVKGLGKVGDREQRKESSKATAQLARTSIQQFNRLLKEAERPLLEE